MQFDFDFQRDHLEQILIGNEYINEWYTALSKFLPEYGIHTSLRVAAFLAQTSHESSNYSVLKENLNYRAATLRKVFPKYFPNDKLAEQYAALPNKREAIANRVYSNRMGNGNELTGDGFRFCGRGLIQLTGRNNYQAFANSVDVAIEQLPEYIVTFDGAVQSACWFWETNNLNVWADKQDITMLTKKINGGIIGLADRIKHYDHICKVLHCK